MQYLRGDLDVSGGLRMTSAVPVLAVQGGPVSALVVAPTSSDATFLVATLSGAGIHVIVVDNFGEAKTLVSRQPPAILVTELRLAEYNGLHLVLRGKAARPEIAALVISDVADPVLQRDAEQMGATFLHKPLDRNHFLAALARTLYRGQDDQPVRPPFERRIAARRAATAVLEGGEERRQTDRRRELLAPRPAPFIPS